MKHSIFILNNLTKRQRMYRNQSRRKEGFTVKYISNNTRRYNKTLTKHIIIMALKMVLTTDHNFPEQKSLLINIHVNTNSFFVKIYLNSQNVKKILESINLRILEPFLP